MQNHSNILLVEDNRGDVRLVKEVLSEANKNLRVDVAPDGEAALTYLQDIQNASQKFPDLILLDLNLPKKDGREVLQEIKMNSLLRQIPVVIFTSSSARSDIQRSYDLNANCYVVKPNDFDEYASTLRSIHSFWLNTVLLPRAASY